MNAPLEENLIQALSQQTAAINRLAESNESLVAVIYDSFLSEDDDHPAQIYLNGKPRG